MESNWIIGFGAAEHEYKIGDVTYIVTSRFAKPTEPEKKTLSERMKGFVGGDYAELTVDPAEDTIDCEYVCSAAGKED